MFNPKDRGTDRRGGSLLSLARGSSGRDALPRDLSRRDLSRDDEAEPPPRAARPGPRPAEVTDRPAGDAQQSGRWIDEREQSSFEPRQTQAGAAADPAPQSRFARGRVRSAAPEEEEWKPLLDPVKIFKGIVRSRYIILATTVAGALLGVAIALSTPKKYESIGELLIDPREIKVVDRDITQGGLPSDATLAIVENQVRVIRSGSVLDKVVDTLNLAADPEFNGQGSGGFSLRGLIADLRSMLSSSDDAPASADRKRALAVKNLAESLSVKRSDRTFIVTVGVETQNPDKSALIANTVTDVFVQSYGELQSETAGRANDELTARLAELRSAVEDAERKVETYRADHDLIDAKGGLISDDEILKLNDQLTTARARTLELNARAQSARGLSVNSAVNGALPEQLSSPVMTELRTRYTNARQTLDRLSVRLGPRHPERLAAEAEVNGVRDAIGAELTRISSGLQVELRRAVQLEQDLASRLAQLKARQGTVSDDLVQLRELERDATSKRAVYESFLLRARETGEQRGFNTANVSIISPARPPLEPLGPSRAMVAIAGMIAGLMAGVGIGALRGVIDSLRGDGSGGAPSDSRRRRPMRRREGEDEIDRIMDGAAASWADDRDAPAPRRAMRQEQAAHPAGPPSDPSPELDEIREAVREFRNAVRDFSEIKARISR